MTSLSVVVAAVARARSTAPWPERDVLPDGSQVYRGLTDEQINVHLARQIISELLAATLPDDVVNRAGHSVFVAESNTLNIPADEEHYKVAASTYRSAAVSGFRGVLRELLKN